MIAAENGEGKKESGGRHENIYSNIYSNYRQIFIRIIAKYLFELLQGFCRKVVKARHRVGQQAAATLVNQVRMAASVATRVFVQHAGTGKNIQGDQKICQRAIK
jgi:hypothetical protein